MDVLSPEQMLVEGQQALEAGNYQRARELFFQVAEASPQADLHQVLASIAFELGNLEEAKSHLKKALALDSEFVDAYEGLAKIYFEEGHLALALQNQEHVVLRQPDNLPALVSAAVLTFELKQYARAQRYVDRVLAIQPDHLEALLIAGRALKEQKQYTKAMEVLSRALTLEPNLVDARVALGLCQLEQRQIEAARNSFEEAIARAPRLVEAWSGLARLYLAQRDYNMAIPALKKCLELAPNEPRGYIDLGWAYAEAYQYELAGDVASQALERFPDEASVAGKMGALLFRLKAYDRAELILQKALLLEPANPDTQESLGYTYLVQKDYGQAVRHFKRGWQLRPLAPSALFNIWFAYALWGYHTLRNGRFGLQVSLKNGIKLTPGRSRSGQLLDLGHEHFNAGDYAKAAMCYRKIKESDVNFEIASLWLANCRLKQGVLDEAVEICNRGLAKAPASAPLMSLLGALLLAQNKPRNAIRILNRSLELDPDLGDAWATLGRAYQKDMKYEDAYHAYQRAIELNVPDPYLYRHVGDCAMALEDRAQAAAAYKLAVGSNPRDLISCQRLVECCYLGKHYDEGIAYAKHALSIDSKCYAAHVWLGRIYRSLQSFEAAKEAFEAAIAQRPTMGYLYRQLGALCETTTDWYDAIEAYQTALALDENDIEAERGLKRSKKMVGKR